MKFLILQIPVSDVTLSAIAECFNEGHEDCKTSATGNLVITTPLFIDGNTAKAIEIAKTSFAYVKPVKPNANETY